MDMSIKYRPHIDGLRALAVSAVVMYHAFPSLIPGGFIGVDIFFVISGYLITSILIGGLDNGKFSIIEFYRRRINRIFPALIFMMLAVLIFGWFTLFTDEYMQVGKHIAAGAGFVSNISLFYESGYFDLSSQVKPLLHLWSLGVEEQYYIFLPLFLLVIFRSKMPLLITISSVAIFSLIISMFEIKENQSAAFYLPQFRAWELFAGSIISCIEFKSSFSAPGWVKRILPIPAFLTLIACFAFYSESMPFPGVYALPPVAASCFVILFTSRSATLMSFLSNRIVVFIGLISYPLYLWHWPMLSLSRIINGEQTSVEVRVIAVLFSIFMACITYFFVEKPLKRVRSSKLKTIPLLALMAFTGIGGYLVFVNNGVENRGMIENRKEVSRQLNGALWQYVSNEKCKARYHFSDQDKMPVWFCELSEDKGPNVMLLGNSYANHLYPGIANNRNNASNILSIGTSDVTLGYKAEKGSPLEKQMHFLNEIIKDEKSIRTVIISGVNPTPDALYIKNFMRRIDLIKGEGKQVIIFYPHAKMNKNIKACFTRPLKPATQVCKTDTEEIDSIRHDFNLIKSAVAAKYPDIKFFDPNDAFCDKFGCSSVVDGLPVFRDDYKHFSVYASMKVGENFFSWLKENDIKL